MGKNRDTMASKLQAHVRESAQYGGHDGKGGLQVPKDRHVSKPMKNPSPTDAIFRVDENKIPQTGPATGAGMLGGPIGTGSLQRN
jgi:hypothetical protein